MCISEEEEEGPRGPALLQLNYDEGGRRGGGLMNCRITEVIITVLVGALNVWLCVIRLRVSQKTQVEQGVPNKSADRLPLEKNNHVG